MNGAGYHRTVKPLNPLSGKEIGTVHCPGTVFGLLDFQREMLDPVRNELGRFAVTLTETFNAQHTAGMDLNGHFRNLSSIYALPEKVD